nr:uncharacterized protein C11orf98-like [Odocoileus virginianus texanus]
MELKKKLFKLGLVFYLERRLSHHVDGAVIDEGLIIWKHLKKQVRMPTLPCGKRRRRLPQSEPACPGRESGHESGSPSQASQD